MVASLRGIKAHILCIAEDHEMQSMYLGSVEEHLMGEKLYLPPQDFTAPL